MSIEDNPFLRMQKACQGSCEHPSYPAGEERCWNEEQLKKIEKSGYFELRPVRVRIFGDVYFMTRPNYRALLTIMALCLLCISIMVTCSLISVIQP